jgi:hypothetical protein
MSVRYEAVRLLLRLGVVFGLALVIAAIAAVVHGGGNRHSLELCCYVVGSLMFVMGAAGNSPGRGYALDVESGMAGSSTWRTIVGDPANAPTKTLAPAVPFFVAAFLLILLGLAASYSG